MSKAEQAEHRLSNEEREVIITWTAADDLIHITAEIPSFARMLDRRGYRPDPDGFYRIPVGKIRVLRPEKRTSTLDPEKRRQLAENLAKNRARRAAASE